MYIVSLTVNFVKYSIIGMLQYGSKLLLIDRYLKWRKWLIIWSALH